MNPDAEQLQDEEDWVEIGCYPHEEDAHEHALVILAMGMPCWITTDPGRMGYQLLVSQKYESLARHELQQYEEERLQSHPDQANQPSPFTHSPGWTHYFLWAVTLVAVHRLQAHHPELVELGASSSTGLIDQHQWWRPFTALFLHSDLEHLLGNLLSGLFFTTLVASSIGATRAWLLILASGAMGNLATSLMVWPEPYRSIGASTAVFAALGILSGLGLAWMLRFRKQVPWLRMIAPLIGGIVVLGMTGSGLPESNTDVMGHVFGFAAGVISGAIWGSLTERLSYKASSGTSREESGAPT